ncbi:condensation domain-containing protein, partial [Fistulina hepatica ATCC 64428]
MEVLDFVSTDIPFSDLSRELDPQIVFHENLAYEKKAFDLTRDVPLRRRLFKLAEENYVLSLTLHHIAYDGYSLGILKRELGQLYSHHAYDTTIHLPPLPIQFRDFAAWQRLPQQEALQHSKLKYWISQLRDNVPAEFPTDFVRPKVLPYDAGLAKFHVDANVVAKMTAIGSELGLTEFMVLLTMFRLLHYRYSGVLDATIGTLNGNRTREEIEGLVGFFVDTSCLRIRLEDHT